MYQPGQQPGYAPPQYPQYAQATYSQWPCYAQQALALPGQQPYTYQPGQQAGYTRTQYPQYAEAPAHQPQRAYEQQQMPQPQHMMVPLLQQLQTQQQNWGMGSMNGMGMGGMQNIQNMQHRYPGEREREWERGWGQARDTERQRGRAVSPLRGQSARSEDRERDREREEKREGERERERERLGARPCNRSHPPA